MDIDEIKDQIKFWEDEAEAREEKFESAVNMCRYYYKLLDEAMDND